MAYWPNFEVWEGEEATDNAFDYARRYDLDIEQRYALLHAACNDGFVECERGNPVSFFFPVHEDGKEKGRVEMSPYQLPGDAVYDYCKREKYLQPKYTKMSVTQRLFRTFPNFKLRRRRRRDAAPPRRRRHGRMRVDAPRE